MPSRTLYGKYSFSAMSSQKIPSPGFPRKKIPITHKFRSPVLSVIFILEITMSYLR